MKKNIARKEKTEVNNVISITTNPKFRLQQRPFSLPKSANCEHYDVVKITKSILSFVAGDTLLLRMVFDLSEISAFTVCVTHSLKVVVNPTDKTKVYGIVEAFQREVVNE